LKKIKRKLGPILIYYVASFITGDNHRIF